MPSKRRTKRDAKAKDVPKKGPKSQESPKPPVENPAPQTDGADSVDGASRRVNLSFAPPKSTVISGTVATAGTGGLVGAIATGNVEPQYVWPCIVLVTVSMGYDLTRRVVDRVRQA